ncbi:c-type cytochrome [Chitinophaga flava]|uniref:Photosynthetic reaction center cytochrome c subunit n=1 Tax=Chitinophaga flava TaxID=2259036 RepID=A0A365Y1M9_9BACT|nr:c-type cytochrome [Chitinophaga flava]RBL92517.1 c-type cytochrome [Chitinophaga flava]
MKMKKTFMVAAALTAAVTLCSLALPQENEKPKNLKILPKDISHDELISTMRSFNTALGVKCNFCHAQQKDDPKKLDFASDDNQHKDVAREMMKMTKRINKKFFKNSDVMTVSCYTCHHGNEEPKSKPDAAAAPAAAPAPGK